ncbi:MAG: sortase A [Microgenomates group bacterium Gr01-1014_16]|nr:MAG: sortase A [Microgenomates group bacterium Gr01-1014_16]
MRKKISTLFFSLGFLLLLIVILPLVISQLRFILNEPPRLLDPVAAPRRPGLTILGSLTADYTQASNWFYPASLPQPQVTSVKYFTLSLPSLDINVLTEVNGSDLKKNAIHYPGTALPGSLGNSVVFGHSSLPFLYKPTNPLTIFNPLVKAKLGEEIVVNYADITYRYQIKKIREVSPKQLEVLDQDYSKKQLTLITCVPLGTYWRRLVLTAELVN